MASWFATSAEELLRKHIGLAVSPTRSPGTLLAELSETPMQLKAERFAQPVADEAQNPSASLFAGSLFETATSLAEAVGMPAPAFVSRCFAGSTTLSAEEMLQRFDAEAASFSATVSETSGAGASVVAEAEAIMASWEQRLANDFEANGRRLAAPALRALLRSGAPTTLLQAMLACQQAQCCRSHAPPVAGVGDEFLRERSGPMDAASGEKLVHMLSFASAVAPPVLSDLVGVLARSAEAVAFCQSKRLVADNIAAEEEARWVLRIFTSAMTDCNEETLLAASRLSRAVDDALAAASTLSTERASCPPSSADEVPAAVGRQKPQVGEKVWACWPVDGHWYRAQVKAHSQKRDRIIVAWSTSSRRGDSEGYLPASQRGETAKLELGLSAVILVKASIRRPPPVTDEASPEEVWETRLRAVEAHARRFNELCSLCSQLECHQRWEQKQDAVSPAAPCADTAAPSPPLQGAAETLRTLRVEAEERAEALSQAFADCSDEAKRFEEQLRTSAAAAEAERSALREERSRASTTADRLRRRREELQEMLQGVEEELVAAERECVVLDAREEQLEGSMARVAEELAQQLRLARERGVATQRRRDVLEASAHVARSIETGLAERSSAAAEALVAMRRLEGQQELAGNACLGSDEGRRAELRELLAVWHECAWGPEASVLLRSPQLVASVRDGHLRALDVVERALSEADAIAAGTCGGGGLGALDGLLALNGIGCSEEKQVAAKRLSHAVMAYKDFKKQLQENLARLNELEAIAPRTDNAPSAVYSAPPAASGGPDGI